MLRRRSPSGEGLSVAAERLEADHQTGVVIRRSGVHEELKVGHLQTVECRRYQIEATQVGF